MPIVPFLWFDNLFSFAELKEEGSKIMPVDNFIIPVQGIGKAGGRPLKWGK